MPRTVTIVGSLLLSERLLPFLDPVWWQNSERPPALVLPFPSLVPHHATRQHLPGLAVNSSDPGWEIRLAREYLDHRVNKHLVKVLRDHHGKNLAGEGDFWFSTDGSMGHGIASSSGRGVLRGLVGDTERVSCSTTFP